MCREIKSVTLPGRGIDATGFIWELLLQGSGLWQKLAIEQAGHNLIITRSSMKWQDQFLVWSVLHLITNSLLPQYISLWCSQDSHFPSLNWAWYRESTSECEDIEDLCGIRAIVFWLSPKFYSHIYTYGEFSLSRCLVLEKVINIWMMWKIWILNISLFTERRNMVKNTIYISQTVNTYIGST